MKKNNQAIKKISIFYNFDVFVFIIYYMKIKLNSQHKSN